MNAVCQILLNLEEMRKVFSLPDFNKCINVKNKCGRQGKVMTEFLNICKERWYDEQTRTLNIRKLKEKYIPIETFLKCNKIRNLFTHYYPNA